MTRRKSRWWLLLLLPVAGCNFYYNTLPSPDDAVKLIPWFDHMIVSPAVHPYQRADIPHTTVPGTVPVTGGEADWRVGDPAQAVYGFDVAVADRVLNPTDPAATLAVGDTLYHTYCAVCHGNTGAADGTVTAFVGGRSLLTPIARGYTDGYLYSIIRYGRGVMPMYGDKIRDPARRWAVVNYVRKLQADAPVGGTN